MKDVYGVQERPLLPLEPGFPNCSRTTDQGTYG